MLDRGEQRGGPQFPAQAQQARGVAGVGRAGGYPADDPGYEQPGGERVGVQADHVDAAPEQAYGQVEPGRAANPGDHDPRRAADGHDAALLVVDRLMRGSRAWELRSSGAHRPGGSAAA
jgi:hypothetical protein